MSGKAISRVIIGGLIAVVCVPLCLLALMSAGMMLWQIYNGNQPDFVMIGNWSMSAWAFVGLACVALVGALGLIGISVQFLMHTNRRE